MKIYFIGKYIKVIKESLKTLEQAYLSNIPDPEVLVVGLDREYENYVFITRPDHGLQK